MLVLYGLQNCDTVRKARAWLDGQSLAYRFHDFKKSGVPEAALARWLAQAGWERLLNRQGTTWRKLDAAVQGGVVDAVSAAAVMRDYPSVIKRPVLESGDAVIVGFDAQRYAQLR
ncbi:MAG: ArsC family reductase [Methylibium sp.]|uniref:ArsC family reductase n=1 Tax=Methylibium sp. TaxID=2067992 RepID=UPI001837CCA8|nr:ArsC family reductase [Methylibium sp.]MBA3598407.1 ArsC family reductase [Methylibium sp.]